MKIPEEINVYPLDIKKDKDTKGLWFYVPEWIVRAYKLKSFGSNMGKVKFIIKKRDRAIFEYEGEMDGKYKYYKNNWAKKMLRERKKQIFNL